MRKIIRKCLEYILRDTDDYFTLNAFAKRTIRRLIIFFAVIGMFLSIAILLARCG